MLQGVVVSHNPVCPQSQPLPSGVRSSNFCPRPDQRYRQLMLKFANGFGQEVVKHDQMVYDGLHDIFTDQAMGNLTELMNSYDRSVS